MGKHKIQILNYHSIYWRWGLFEKLVGPPLLPITAVKCLFSSLWRNFVPDLWDWTQSQWSTNFLFKVSSHRLSQAQVRTLTFQLWRRNFSYIVQIISRLTSLLLLTQTWRTAPWSRLSGSGVMRLKSHILLSVFSEVFVWMSRRLFFAPELQICSLKSPDY